MSHVPIDPTLAAWLHDLCPAAPLAALEDSLRSNRHLPLAIQALRDRVSGVATGGGQKQLERAQQKIQTLRDSLSHFGAHANSLSDRLFRAESACTAQQHEHARNLADFQKERDGLKALCLVWEGRWREERSLREEAEENLRKSESSKGRIVNGESQLVDTRLVVTEGLQRPATNRSRPLESPSAKAWNVASTPTSERPSNEVIKADVEAEMERLRSELRELSESRDVEVTRLEAELRLRRDEMTQLYSSLDQLVFLGAPSTIPTVTAPISDNLGHSRSRGRERNPEPKHSRIPLPNEPAVQAAASHSQGRLAPDQPDEDHTVEDAGETVRLEEEIREMERRIRLLSGEPESEGSSVEPEDGSFSPDEPDELASEQARLMHQVVLLEADLEATRNELERANEEKRKLEDLVEQARSSSFGVEHSEREQALRAYVERLEADRSRLSQSLEASEAEALSLSQELSSMHAQVDSLSERVRAKLQEQRKKLLAAYDEIDSLRGESGRKQ